MPFKFIFYSILLGATLTGKNMLPIGSIFFPLIVAPFKTCFLYLEIYLTFQKLVYDHTDTNILREGAQWLIG